jgi:hypothetical protein
LVEILPLKNEVKRKDLSWNSFLIGCQIIMGRPRNGQCEVSQDLKNISNSDENNNSTDILTFSSNQRISNQVIIPGSSIAVQISPPLSDESENCFETKSKRRSKKKRRIRQRKKCISVSSSILVAVCETHCITGSQTNGGEQDEHVHDLVGEALAGRFLIPILSVFQKQDYNRRLLKWYLDDAKYGSLEDFCNEFPQHFSFHVPSSLDTSNMVSDELVTRADLCKHSLDQPRLSDREASVGGIFQGLAKEVSTGSSIGQGLTKEVSAAIIGQGLAKEVSAVIIGQGLVKEVSTGSIIGQGLTKEVSAAIIGPGLVKEALAASSAGASPRRFLPPSSARASPRRFLPPSPARASSIKEVSTGSIIDQTSPRRFLPPSSTRTSPRRWCPLT